MILHKPVNIPFANELIECTRAQISQDDNLPLYVKNIAIDDALRSSINQYLNSKGVSELSNILAFSRRNYHVSMQHSHIDCYNDGIVNCSVVIPVDGCENTGQVWYGGSYETTIIKKDGYTYSDIVWNSPTKVLGYKSILEPTLVRTNIPHGVYNSKNEYRTTCTIRFKNNETFEFLAEALSI